MRSDPQEGPLPDYTNPPVVEVILGIQFDRLPGFQNAHLGAFWKTLDATEWPTVSDAPPLEPQFENFAESASWAKFAMHVKLTQDPSSRLQIKNKAGNRMIQAQNSRLLFNWLGQAGGPYPRYRNVREGFVEILETFLAFVGREKLGEFRPNQWEVSYLNHIPRGTVWNTRSDWGFFRPFGGVPTIEGLLQGESFNGEWHFVIPDQRGRLHVAWQHGRRSDPKKQEMIVLTLTARGPLEQNKKDVSAVLAGLDLGHATIVHAFQTFMADEARQYWRSKDGSD
ncbi:MAG TPA: TIGR04255 family protein [Gemmataceae bacterium]|nr:TIGR04255 family protein [Gemmataceae bacterium]